MWQQKISNSGYNLYTLVHISRKETQDPSHNSHLHNNSPKFQHLNYIQTIHLIVLKSIFI